MNAKNLHEARLVRLRAFLEKCRRGEEQLPERGQIVNYSAIGRLLFGSGQAVGKSSLRDLIDAYHNELTKKRTALAIAQAGLDLQAGVPRHAIDRNGRRRKRGEWKEDIKAFVAKCARGEAVFPLHASGRPNFAALRRAALGDIGDHVLAHNHEVQSIIAPFLATLPAGVTGRPEFGGNIVYSPAGVPVNVHPTKYELLPWAQEEFAQALKDLESVMFKGVMASKAWKTAFFGWRDVRAPRDFATWLANVMASPTSGKTRGVHHARLLYWLRLRKILLPPLGILAGAVPQPVPGRRLYIPQECFTEWEYRVGTWSFETSGNRSVQSLLINICRHRRPRVPFPPASPGTRVPVSRRSWARAPSAPRPTRCPASLR